MKMGVLIRVFFCLLSCGGFLYAYINKQNAITELRLEIPAALQDLRTIEQENVSLQFEIDQFEDPKYLMELARRPEFRHLKHPLSHEILSMPLPKERMP